MCRLLTLPLLLNLATVLMASPPSISPLFDRPSTVLMSFPFLFSSFFCRVSYISIFTLLSRRFSQSFHHLCCFFFHLLVSALS